MIELQGIGKTFGVGASRTRAVADVNLKIKPRSIVALIGPSGCGKSTLLNMVAGLYRPSSGQVVYDGRSVSDVNTDVGYMTQKDNLLPWRLRQKLVDEVTGREVDKENRARGYELTKGKSYFV